MMSESESDERAESNEVTDDSDADEETDDEDLREELNTANTEKEDAKPKKEEQGPAAKEVAAGRDKPKERVRSGRVRDAASVGGAGGAPYLSRFQQRQRDIDKYRQMKAEVMEDMRRHLKTPFVRKAYEYFKREISPENFKRFELQIYSACLCHPYPL